MCLCVRLRKLCGISNESFCAAGLAYQPRRGSERRSQASADLEDILVAFERLDETENIPEIFCNLVMIPPVVINNCTELIQRNGSSLEAIQSKLDHLSSDLSTLSSKLTALETTPLAQAVNSSSTGVSQSQHRTPTSSGSPVLRRDRQENLMVFGLAESPSMSDYMDSVQKMLQFVTGRTTPVKDLFRIGKYRKPDSDDDQHRPRPTILKLLSPWDRRIVLANQFKLKDYEIKGIFVREDLSPEVRKQRRENYAARNAWNGSPQQ